MSVCIVFCVLFPVGLTAIAPVTYLRLTRNGDEVSAQSKTCLLFIIPYYTQSIQNVLEVNSKVVFGTLPEFANTSGSSTDRDVRPEDEGTLTLSNHEQKISISVSPANLEDYAQDIRDFIVASGSDAAAGHVLKRFCVANWKASVFAGVPVSMLTVLFLVSIASSLVSWLCRFATGKSVGVTNRSRSPGR